MIINRIRRFYQSFDTKISSDDMALVEFFLPMRLAALFFAMAAVDRKHCLSTAKAALKIAQKTDQKIDQKLLFQAALLHDAGRREGDMALWQRVAAVLLNALCRRAARRIAKSTRPRGSFSYALYIYYNHPAIGAGLIRQAGGGEELAGLIAFHHSRREAPPELMVLREADELN